MLKIKKIVIFEYFWLLQFVSSEFWAGQGVGYTEFLRNGSSVFLSCVPNYFFIFLNKRGQQGGVLKLRKIGHFMFFWPLCSVSPGFLANLGLVFTIIDKICCNIFAVTFLFFVIDFGREEC